MKNKNEEPEKLNSDVSALDDLFKPNNNEDEYYKAIKEFYDDEEFLTKTRLSLKEVSLLVRLKFYNFIVKKYDKDLSVYLENIKDSFIKLKISQSGEGRREFFATISNINMVKEKSSILDRIRGIK
ncbi:MAG: hypothetical protein QW129_05145 [Thermoplasmata archaeon]